MSTLSDLSQALILSAIGDPDSSNQIIAALEASGSGAASVNGVTGAITLVPGANTTITPSGQNITIASAPHSGTGTITGASSSKMVTDAAVTATSKVFVVLQTNDATANILNVVPASGSFTINLVAPTGTTSFAYIVF
jgi:hypothetical protein